jgi:hypothetical protein
MTGAKGDDMKPVRTLKMYHWIAIDLLAIAVVGGFLLSILAIAVGTWQPSSLIPPDYWRLLAFLAWTVIGSGAVVLLAWQLNAMGVLEASPIGQPTTRGERTRIEERLAPVLITERHRPTTEFEPFAEDKVDGTEEAEPVLVSAGT